MYLSSEAQRSTAAPAATLGTGAGTSASTSMPLLSRSVPTAPTASVDTVEQRKDRHRKQLADHWKQVQNFLATCLMTNLVERQKAYDNYLAAFTQFEVDFPPETPPANTARCRREADAADAGVRFNEPTRQTVDPVVRSQIFQNSSLLVQNDLLSPSLAGAHNRNSALSNTQLADNEAVNYGDDEGRVQGYDPPPHESQLGSGWYNPNQNGYYQPMQTYPSPDPVVQHVFDQEHYAA